jgi:hypothetical protein
MVRAACTLGGLAGQAYKRHITRQTGKGINQEGDSDTQVLWLQYIEIN